MHVFYVYNKNELLLSFICYPLQDIELSADRPVAIFIGRLLQSHSQLFYVRPMCIGYRNM